MHRIERYTDPEEVQRIAFDAFQGRIWTSLPGIVQSFDPDKNTCTVQPAVSLKVMAEDGTRSDIQLPVLLDCPVVWQSGGGCTLTFPVSPGDECLVSFSSRCIDGWWQSGTVSPQAELRMHDLSDGFAFIGPRSLPRAFSVSTSAVQLRTDDGSAYVEINPTTKKIKAHTSGDAEVSAVNINLIGNVSVIGNMSVSGSMTNNGKNVGATHVHSGVSTGSSNTGQPI